MTLREEQKQKSRGTILRIAAEEFDQRGYAAVAMSEVAARAGLTKGSVYFHFSSKAELAEAVVETYFARWSELRSEVEKRDLNGLEAIRWMSLRVAEAYQADPGVRAPLRLMREADVIGVDLPTPFVGWIEATREHLLEAQRDGQLHPDLSIDAAAWQLVAAFFGAQEISHQLTGSKDLTERVEELWHVVLPGLSAGGEVRITPHP